MNEDEVINEIVGILLANERVCLQDIHNRFPYESVRVELLIHKAREKVRLEHKIDFAPIPKLGGYIHRATPKQIEERSHRGRRAGIKKLTRAQQRMTLAAEKTLAPEDRERLERKAAHQATQLLAAKVRQRRVVDP
jgi:hypothetical protein